MISCYQIPLVIKNLLWDFRLKKKTFISFIIPRSSEGYPCRIPCPLHWYFFQHSFSMNRILWWNLRPMHRHSCFHGLINIVSTLRSGTTLVFPLTPPFHFPKSNRYAHLSTRSHWWTVKNFLFWRKTAILHGSIDITRNMDKSTVQLIVYCFLNYWTLNLGNFEYSSNIQPPKFSYIRRTFAERFRAYIGIGFYPDVRKFQFLVRFVG